MTGHNTKSQISGILLVIIYIVCTGHSTILLATKLVYLYCDTGGGNQIGLIRAKVREQLWG